MMKELHGLTRALIANMVEGRLKKFYEETVLFEQTSMIDGESKISSLLEQAEKDSGAQVILKGFIHYILGEGV